MTEKKPRKSFKEEFNKELDEVAIAKSTHYRNVEASEKLLHLLEFYHGGSNGGNKG